MRRSVTGIFFLNGAVFSGWYARLPAIQDDLGLDPGQLGVALLGAPLALLIAQPVVGAIAARTGSRPFVVASPLYMCAVVLPALAVSGPTLFLAVACVGAVNGALDISMNAQGVAVERAVGRPIFNSLHAAFSFGALTGAAIAAGAAAAGIDPLVHLAVMAVVGAACSAMLIPGLIHDPGAPDAPRLARPSIRLAALGAIAFCALLAEGAVFDWSGIYLESEAGSPAGLAPLGLAAFSLCMGVGRLTADGVAARHGAAPVARAGAALAAVGLGVALVRPVPAVAIAGFAVMGLGLSAVFPLALRAAGAQALAPGPELAAVSTVGYTGFLAGPPLIGLLADEIGLRGALALVCALCVVAAALAAHVRAPREAGQVDRPALAEGGS
jgi:MFS family permease